MRIVTMSFDDGIQDDRRLVTLLNRYGCRATFFLNSAFDDETPPFQDEGATVYHLAPHEMQTLYQGHEIGAHTHSHPFLTALSDAEIRDQLRQNIDLLTKWFGVKPVGFAYTYGVYDERVIRLVKEQGFAYARTITNTHSFVPQTTHLLELHPTVWLSDPNRDEIVHRFLQSQDDGILHIWGHSYELTGHQKWDAFEQLLQVIRQSGVKCVALQDVYC